MKAAILYDLADPVEVSEEDAELFAMVNHGPEPVLTDRVIVQAGRDLYLVKRPNRKRQLLLAILWVAAAVLAFVAAVLLLPGSVVVLALPFKVPSVLSLIAWVVYISFLLLADRFKN